MATKFTQGAFDLAQTCLINRKVSSRHRYEKTARSIEENGHRYFPPQFMQQQRLEEDLLILHQARLNNSRSKELSPWRGMERYQGHGFFFSPNKSAGSIRTEDK
ncbi:hypothetical protein CDAR_547261 [Caerostris darwini]|uniref:Uncharacterized protein n=1 Tax=Caerostris darwini TaxID=1538125 RepID=A0AAV4WTI6_9ARAC|nr:hypothetical protein CDAR_547261 [Caerostris darwini]